MGEMSMVNPFTCLFSLLEALDAFKVQFLKDWIFTLSKTLIAYIQGHIHVAQILKSGNIVKQVECFLFFFGVCRHLWFTFGFRAINLLSLVKKSQNDDDNCSKMWIKEILIASLIWLTKKFLHTSNCLLQYLKALLNNVFTLKIWAACPYMLSASLIRCTNEALKKCTSKPPLSASKKWKWTNDQIYLTHFSP